MTAVERAECPACGAEINSSDHYCEACRARLVDAPSGDVLSADRRELDGGHLAAVSDRGRVHRRNEDAFFVAVRPDRSVALVCDGVSSSASPDLAARAAADAAGSYLRDAPGETDAHGVMLNAVAAARAAVEQVPWTPEPRRGAPACTLVAALYNGVDLTVASVGDSRAYWIDDGRVDLLTRDDSWAAAAVAAGLRGANEVMADPRAHTITAWIGADAPDDPPQVVCLTPRRGGRLILCTDGLWNLVDADDLATRVVSMRGARPMTVARTLTEQAVQAGGHDNITVAVVDVSSTTASREE